jgi:response regulator RpfG family c-di-GMP phosphodiesterase
VLAPATVESCDALIDEYITEPISRERLLGRVETALRMATYDVTIAELVSLTVRRRRLQTRSDTGRVDHGSEISPLSERIDELHHRIDDELSDVESQYAALVGRRHRPSTRQDTGDERT